MRWLILGLVVLTGCADLNVQETPAGKPGHEVPVVGSADPYLKFDTLSRQGATGTLELTYADEKPREYTISNLADLHMQVLGPFKTVHKTCAYRACPYTDSAPVSLDAEGIKQAQSNGLMLTLHATRERMDTSTISPANIRLAMSHLQ